MLENITNEHKKISIIMVTEFKFNIFLRFITNKNIILCLKL